MTAKKINVRQLATLAMLSAVLLVMSFTPFGYLNVGPLAISLNMIPVAIGAIALGPAGGAVLGAVFGITSFLQCLGIGGTSYMGVILFEISPVLAFIQRFVPRLIAGALCGVIFKSSAKLFGNGISGFITGFCAAALNTVLFMTALLLLFGYTDYMQDLIGGKNILLFACTFVGVNALVEMLTATAVVGLVSQVLDKAGMLRR